MNDFDMDISAIDPFTLQVMIDCRYFAFSANRYTDVTAISPALGVAFITQNQADFMATKNSIPISDSLFESLMLSESIQKEYKDELFIEYAESYMTAGVATKMVVLKLPVTKEIVDIAMNCVDQKNKAEILFTNIDGQYADLVDRTKRHEVLLSATQEHYLLAEYLEKIGYITSKEEKTETQFDPALERKKTQKFLKLRVKKV